MVFQGREAARDHAGTYILLTWKSISSCLSYQVVRVVAANDRLFRVKNLTRCGGCEQCCDTAGSVRVSLAAAQ